MARSSNQKLKILYLLQILLEKTDETHSITMPEIIAELERRGVSAERKSLYDDIERLRTLDGIDIIGEQKDRTYYYRVSERKFELAELKVLVDSVQSAKFITAKKSQELIKKIESLGSQYEASKLQRQVYMSERVKTANESIYYNVDALHDAISSNSKITFHYFMWDASKKMVLRREGALYKVSPWALFWDDENYYMVAFDESEQKIKHFRVDKMLHIEATGEMREGKEHFSKLDMGAYTKKMFGMFAAEEQMVKLTCKNELAGVMIDRFGKDIFMHRLDDEHFSVSVKVAVSKQFLAWVISLGEGVKITGPTEVVEEIREEIKRLVKQYS